MLGKIAARVAALPAVAGVLASVAASRWYLLLRTIPFVLMALAARVFVVDVLGLALFPKELVSTFSQSAIFVVAILLSGVLEDYKEAEGMPDALAAELEGAADRVAFAAASLPAGAISEGALRGVLLSALEDVFAFLAGKVDDAVVISGVAARFCAVAVALAAAGAADSAEAVLGHGHEVRKVIGRLYVIKRTDFLQSGAALMELLVNITVGLAVAAREDAGDGILATYGNVAFTAFQFFYVIELLRDIDDPFEYNDDALMPTIEVDDEGVRIVCSPGAGQSAEVDPFPLMNVYGRLMRNAVFGRARCAFIEQLRARMGEVWAEMTEGAVEEEEHRSEGAFGEHLVKDASECDDAVSPGAEADEGADAAPPVEDTADGNNDAAEPADGSDAASTPHSSADLSSRARAFVDSEREALQRGGVRWRG